MEEVDLSNRNQMKNITKEIKNISARFKNIELVLNIWKWENECSSSTPILWIFEHIISANDDTFKRNVDRSKEYKSKLTLFPLKGGKHKKGMIAGGFLYISVKN